MRFKSSKLIAAFLLFFACVSVYSQSVPHTRSREEFAAAMAKIKEEVAKEQVLALLGPPDDIRTQFDPGGISRVGTKEIWCYGAKKHLDFPTLGCVYIDGHGRTQEVFGGRGQPPKSGLFTEDQLQNLLQLLNTSPGLEGYHYDPLPLIKIVNTLQPLGKEKALAAIGEYLRVSGEWSEFDGPRQGMFLVCRVLFDLPDDINPNDAGGFGMPEPTMPKDPHRIPRFPIALVDDIPLMLVSGYELEGIPTPMENVVKFYEANGRLRSHPLAPSNDPLAALDDLMKSPQWIFAGSLVNDPGEISFGAVEDDNREMQMLMEQLLRLIDSAYRLPVDMYGNRLPSCGQSPEPTWKKATADISARKIKWDAHQNMYVFQKGIHLPNAETKIYQRKIWELKDAGLEHAELILERKSDAWVDISLNWSEALGAHLFPASLVIYDDYKSPVFTYDFTNTSGFGGGSMFSQEIELKEGTDLHAQFVILGCRTNLSSVLKP